MEVNNVKIEELDISEYRSCINTKIRLRDDLSVLIGPNGSGKTNILKAFRLLNSLIYDRYSGRSDADADPVTSKLRVVFRCNEKKVILHATVKIRTDENNDDEILSSEQSWYAKDFTGSAKRIQVPLNAIRHLSRLSGRSSIHHGYNEARIIHLIHESIPDEAVGALKSIHGFLSQLRYYSASQFINPSLCPVSFEVEKHGDMLRSIRQSGHGRFLYDLYTLRDTSGYKQFIDVIGKNGIGLINDIDFQEIKTSQNTYKIRTGGQVKRRRHETVLIVPRFSIGNNFLSPNQLSEGTFKTITLLFYLMTRQGSILLIEEPEVCIHHGLLSSIIELIKTYSHRRQIVVTTHSDYVLDQVLPEQVYKILRDDKSGTKVEQISKSMNRKDFRALKNYLDTEGNLGEYWRHGGLDDN